MEQPRGKTPGAGRGAHLPAGPGDPGFRESGRPDSPPAASLDTGDLYARAGDYGQALRTFEALWELPVYHGELGVARRIAYCLERLGRFGDAIRLLRPLMAAAPEADVAGPDERLEIGRCRLILGKSLLEAGQLSEAQAEGQRAAAVLREVEAPEPGFVENLLGTISFRLGDVGQARRHFRNGLERFRSRGDVNNLALSYINLGNLHKHDCDWGRALEHYQAAFYLRATEGEFQDQGAILLNLGITLAKVGRFGEAKERLMTALNQSLELSNPSRAARARLALVRIAREANELETAEEHLAALEKAGTPPLPEREACLHQMERIHLARLSARTDGLRDELASLRSRVQRMASRGDLMVEVELLDAVLNLDTQDWAAASDAARRALELALEAKDRFLEGQSHLLNLEIAVRSGDTVEADRLHAKLHDRYQRDGEQPSMARLYQLRGRMELRCRRDPEEALGWFTRAGDLWQRLDCPRSALLNRIRGADALVELKRVEEARDELRRLREPVTPQWLAVPAVERGLRRLEERIRRAEEDSHAVRLNGERAFQRLEETLALEMGPGEKLRSIVTVLVQALEADGAVLARIAGDSLEAVSTVSMGRLRGKRIFPLAVLGLGDPNQAGVIEPPAGEDDPGGSLCALAVPVRLQGREHVFYAERRDPARPRYTRPNLDYAMVLMAAVARGLRSMGEPETRGEASPQHGIWLADVVTQNSRMLSILELIRKVAPSDLTVLLQGETGTGKKLLAKALHRISERRNGPFVTVDCAALPDTLLESELFGHRKGAFTGAIQDRVGLLEEANSGTIFLDEIDKAGLGVQRRFLHMLDSGEIRPVGATGYRGLDVRVVCATSCPDLRQEVAEGRFLKDLYYRLNDISVVVPPLRERPDDVPLLAEWFLERFCTENGKQVAGVGSSFHTALARHTWPGNVRELEKAIRRAVTLVNDGEVLGSDLLPSAVLESSAAPAENRGGTLKERLERFERNLVLDALNQSEWNKSRAAVDLGLSRKGLKNKIQRYRLDRRRSRRV